MRSMDFSLMCTFERDDPKWLEEQNRCCRDKLACSGNYTLCSGQKRENQGYVKVNASELVIFWDCFIFPKISFPELYRFLWGALLIYIYEYQGEGEKSHMSSQ